MLFDKTLTGYEIKKFMERSTAHFWHESDASIYPMLKKLAHEGTIQAQDTFKGKHGSTSYTTTPSGKAEFSAWMAGNVVPETHRDELLLRLFFGATISHEHTVHLLKTQLKKMQESLTYFSSIQTYVEGYAMPEGSSDNPHKLFWKMTLRNGILQTEAQAAWLEECLDILKRDKS